MAHANLPPPSREQKSAKAVLHSIPLCYRLPAILAAPLPPATLCEPPTPPTPPTPPPAQHLSQPWQRRTDLHVIKMTQLTERVGMRFPFDVFNLTNTTSFDIPINNVTQNFNFNDFPVFGSQLFFRSLFL